MGNSRESNAADIDALGWPARWAKATLPGGRGSDVSPPLRRSDVLAIATPPALAVLYGLVVLVFGADVFDTGRSWPGNAVAFALLGAFFVVSVYGTMRLYDDAGRVAAGNQDWRPNPHLYDALGAVLLLGLRAVQLSTDGQPLADPVPVFVGTAIVSVVISVIVAGPVYLVQRLRYT